MAVVPVVAVAANGVIGADGGLPWYYPEDLKHFKRLTTGHPVVMGRRTYESIVDRIGGPLPGRTNIVLTRSGIPADHEAVHTADNVEAALQRAAEVDDTTYVVGGGSVYEQVLDGGFADRLVVTHVPEEYDGDTYWPGPEFETLGVVDREALGNGLEAVTYRLE